MSKIPVVSLVSFFIPADVPTTLVVGGGCAGDPSGYLDDGTSKHVAHIAHNKMVVSRLGADEDTVLFFGERYYYWAGLEAQ